MKHPLEDAVSIPRERYEKVQRALQHTVDSCGVLAVLIMESNGTLDAEDIKSFVARVGNRAQEALDEG